jgi:hypothetical protein
MIENSLLCGVGFTVRVEICRRWRLELVYHDGGSTVWDDLFATDKDAYAEFYRTLEAEGIRSFLGQPPEAATH